MVQLHIQWTNFIVVSQIFKDFAKAVPKLCHVMVRIRPTWLQRKQQNGPDTWTVRRCTITQKHYQTICLVDLWDAQKANDSNYSTVAAVGFVVTCASYYVWLVVRVKKYITVILLSMIILVSDVSPVLTWCAAVRLATCTHPLHCESE